MFLFVIIRIMNTNKNVPIAYPIIIFINYCVPIINEGLVVVLSKSHDNPVPPIAPNI